MNAKITYEKISESVQIANFPHIKQVKVEPYKKNYILRVTQNNNKYVIFELDDSDVLDDLCQNDMNLLEKTIIKIKEFLQTEYQETKNYKITYTTDCSDVLIKETENTGRKSCLVAILFLILPTSAHADFSFADYPYTLTNLHADNLVDTNSYYTINFTPVQADSTINTYEYINDVWTPVSYTYTVTPNQGVVESTNITIDDTTQSVSGYFHNMTSSTINTTTSLIDTIAGDFIGNAQTGNDYGGAITTDSTPITNIYGDFVDNSVIGGGGLNWGGGAIRTYFTSIENIQGNFINNQTNHSGGAIFNNCGTIENLTGNFIHNTAYMGGAILNNGVINNLTGIFIDNSAYSGPDNMDGNGGAIANQNYFTLSDSSFINNSSYNGGAIASAAYGFTVSDSQFIGNSGAYGGAIWSYDITTFNADNQDIVFAYNQSTIDGGAMYFGNSGQPILNANNHNIIFTHNQAEENGGAIYNNEGTIIFNANDGFITFDNNEIVGGNGNGSAIYNIGTVILNSNNSLGITFSNNGNGGAIYNIGTLTLNSNSENGGNIIFNNNADYAITTDWGALNFTGNIVVRFMTDSDDIVLLDNAVTNIGSAAQVYAQDITGNGTVNNDGHLVIQGHIGTDILVNNTGYLALSATDVTSNISMSQQGSLELMSGTLNYTPHYDGSLYISGDVISNVPIEQQEIIGYDGSSLHISADNIISDKSIGCNLYLTGGTLSNDITGSGQTIIDGTVINEALISQTMVVNSGKSLTTAASGLGANVLNNGNVTLTGGTVNHNITGGGTVTIDGAVENNANLGLVIINENQSLTTAADSIYGISSNNGNLYLNGGTLGYGVRGNVYITGDVTNNAYQSEQIIISNGGMLTTSANLLSNNIDIINAGTLNITSGNLQQNVTGGNTIIGQGATTSATSFVNLELNGVMNVGTNTINIANADINGTINLSISSLNQNSSVYTGGHIIANDITFGDNAILNLTITDTNLQKGDSSGDIEIITANGEWTGDIATFTSNNLYDIAYNTENHTVTFTRKKFGADLITELNGTELDINIAGVWDELQSSDNPNIQNIINAIDYNSQHNATKYAKLIHNLAPQNHQVTVGAVRNVSTLIDNHVFTRLATLRRPQINRTNANLRKRRANPFYYYGNYRGRNGGDTEPTANNGIWVEGLYNYAQQKDDTKFSGNTFGVMGGFDSKLTEHLTAGLGYAFNKTNIDADNHDIDAMGHTGFVYAEYKPTQWYLDALLSYNLTNYQNSAALIDNLTVKSDYKTNSLSGALTSGYDFQRGLDLYGGLNYIGIKQDAYTDTVGQYIKADDTQMLTLKAGGRYKLTSQKMKRASTVLKAAVLYDVMSDDGVATVTVGNNNYIVHGNGIDPFGVQAGIMFDSFGGNTYLSIGYDLEWRNNFISHTGYIKLKYNF